MPCFAGCWRSAQGDFCAGGWDLDGGRSGRGAGTEGRKSGAGAGAGWAGSCVRPAGHPALCFDRMPPGRQDVGGRSGDVHHVGDPADREALPDAIAVGRA
jgi:hypothetical protein